MKIKNVIHDLLYLIYNYGNNNNNNIKIAAYDSYACLGLANSELSNTKITSDAFKKKIYIFFLFDDQCTIERLTFQSIINYNHDCSNTNYNDYI